MTHQPTEHRRRTSDRCLRLGDLLNAEPSDRSELVEVLRDAAARHIMDGGAFNIIFGALQVADIGGTCFEVLNADSRRLRLLQVTRAA